MVNLAHYSKQVDARLYPNFSDPTAIFASPPSPEVDTAWNRIEDNMILGITREDVMRVGKDPETAVKMNPDWGVEGDLYLAEVEVFHQIHCLNSLRKALIFNYDYYYGEMYGFEAPQFFESHLRHCTSLLLQVLQCHADTEVITHVWHEDQPQPFPDFGINKQCKDFDALLRWKEETDLEDAHRKFRTYRAPPGTVPIPREPLEDIIDGEATGYKYGVKTKTMYIKGCNA